MGIASQTSQQLVKQFVLAHHSDRMLHQLQGFRTRSEMCLHNEKKQILRHSWLGKRVEHKFTPSKTWLIACFFFVFFPPSTDTWRSMRKSTTSARMMKKRSRGIPKPLFQSVQFPALITTSNTVYQVETGFASCVRHT